MAVRDFRLLDSRAIKVLYDKVCLVNNGVGLRGNSAKLHPFLGLVARIDKDCFVQRKLWYKQGVSN